VRIVRARRRRLLGTLLAAAAASLLVAQTAFGAVDWGPVREVGPSFSYNFGGALARSTKATTSYLHATYTTVKVGGEFIDDNGPFAGVYYRRGNSGGSDWGTPKRLNPKGQHADGGAVVASGRVIYAAYVSYEHWINYDPAEPRPITVRINSNHGGASAWLSRTLEPPQTRVDRPMLAPWATRGFLMTFTDADTGDIVLVSCGDLTLEASGCTAGTVGTTDRLFFDPDNGFAGLPVVAATGDTIAVAWLNSDDSVSYVTKVGEADWTAPAELTAGPADGLSAAAKGGRVAFGWADAAGVKVAIWTSGGGLGTPSTAATFGDTATYKTAYSTAVALAGTSTVGVAFGACRRADCTGGPSTGVDLRWRQSANDGSTWGSASTIASYSVSSERRINDFASVVMTSATKRYVLFNIANPSITKFRVMLRVGTG
jgi:hypothetical protein